MRAPDFATYAAGFRFYRPTPLMVDDKVSDEPRLYPLFKPGVLSKGKNRAACYHGYSGKEYPDRTHEVPSLECDCGLHSFHDPLHALAEISTDVPTTQPHVMVAVLNWGDEVIHDYGTRSEFQMPWAIIDYSDIPYCINDSQCPDIDTLEAFSEAYEIPVIRFEESEKYMERYLHSERQLLCYPLGIDCKKCGREKVEGDIDYRCLERPDYLHLYMNDLLGLDTDE